ncbi:1-pyrroline-5-carboxylate dehydrogenase [Demequina sediminis]|uniref:proline dehydrogenase family protein n=1 Tax=Demequina sediminis TaxID=1930058 RepID=UPI0025731C9E|nr:proline dehydrogenase family protein [Demequina sediminis]BDZ61043.1 1-pyrroline-5-carboxylate dehydrogenase [Demequina sediminis]
MTTARRTPPSTHTAEDVSALVRTWLEAASSARVSGPSRLLERMLRDPSGLPFLTAFVDTVVRPEDAVAAARSLRALATRTPGAVPWPLRWGMRVGAPVSRLAPRTVIRACRRVVRALVGHLVIDATDARLGRAIGRLRADGTRLNLNLLGEAVMGAREADRRLERTRALLAREDVDYVSIKVSAAVAPHSPWAFDATVDAVTERLAPLFEDAALKGDAFVNLDMEEYRDLDVTLAVFMRLLDRPGLERLTAGVVVQAYLPDALGAMVRLQEWAARRVSRGGAPIKVRVVKGANLSMERVDAELHGWPLATWHSKEETDAHYLRVLDYALTPERTAAVRIGIAGHNLFDLAHAVLTARERGVSDLCDVEMLLGMGDAVAPAVARDAGPVRLYTPVVHPAEFDVALAYLVRRLEEVASPQNFVASLARLNPDEAFRLEEERFTRSLAAAAVPTVASHRARGNDAGAGAPPASPGGTGGFRNAADTDPSVPAGREWAGRVVALARDSHAGEATLATARVTTAAEARAAVAATRRGAAWWWSRDPGERAAVLHAVGRALETRRADLCAVMMAESGKTLDQADPEVSEAVDFAHYYAIRGEALSRMRGARPVPREVTVVTPPWNFPVAIPAGSTLAALAAGSAVVLKPAEQSARCAAVLAETLWDAGVPSDALRLAHVDASGLERGVGAALLTAPGVDQVILTGAHETAALFHRLRPGVRLFAETSGKNAIVITPSADLDLAVRDVVQSAFGHAGQKCSAASLAIVVGSVARSRRFLAQLEDAVRSLTVGTAHDPSTQVGPLIERAHGKLARALTSLEPGERWLVEPRRLDADGLQWTPGVRVGVAPGSWFHRTECFGPVLGLMTADTLDDAIALQNGVDYGLTAGLHSLDAHEIARWLSRVEAGNLYVNRGITGAIVQRQPFGGWKASVVGPSAKAGGPSYVAALTGWERDESPLAGFSHMDRPSLEPTVERLLEGAAPWVVSAAAADAHAWGDRFGCATDLSGLAAERNLLRYVPAATEIRWDCGDTDDLLRVCAARLRAGGAGGVSCVAEPPAGLSTRLATAGLTVTVESDDALVARLRAGGLSPG